MIKNSGGVAILAHYNKNIDLNGYTESEMERHIKYFYSIFYKVKIYFAK